MSCQASSGMRVSDECVALFELMKNKTKYTAVVFKINDCKTEIVVDRVFDPIDGCDDGDDEYKLFFDYMKDMENQGQCRYAAYDFKYTISDGSRRKKLIFINFCPDTCTVKPKMLYSSSKDALKASLRGCMPFQANGIEDLEKCEVACKCKENTTYG